jgi:hypothetical protein
MVEPRSPFLLVLASHQTYSFNLYIATVQNFHFSSREGERLQHAPNVWIVCMMLVFHAFFFSQPGTDNRTHHRILQWKGKYNLKHGPSELPLALHTRRCWSARPVRITAPPTLKFKPVRFPKCTLRL